MRTVLYAALTCLVLAVIGGLALWAALSLIASLKGIL